MFLKLSHSWMTISEFFSTFFCSALLHNIVMRLNNDASADEQVSKEGGEEVEVKRDKKQRFFSRTRTKSRESQEQIRVFCEKRKAKEPEQNLIFNMYA